MYQTPTLYNVVSRLFRIRKGRYHQLSLELDVVPVYYLNTYILAFFYSNHLPLDNEDDLFDFTKQIRSAIEAFNFKRLFRIRKIVYDWKKHGRRNRRKKRKGKIKR